jgi:hypothetical protein
MSEVGDTSIRDVVNEFERESLWALLYASASAPETRERWYSLAFLINAALREHAPTKGTGATAADLRRLLGAVEDWEPSIRSMEDFIPKDPRDNACIRLGENTVRIFPGSIERPVADVDRALMLARALDETLVAKLGFGISDLTALVLEHVDNEIAILATAWPAAAETLTEMVTESEILRAIDAMRDHAGDLPSTAAQARALEWITTSIDQVDFDPHHPQSLFGHAMRVVDAGGTTRWMPLSIIPDAFGFAIGELAELVAEEDGVAEKFSRTVASEVRQKLWKFGRTIIGAAETVDGPPVVTGGNYVQWIIAPSPQRALLVQIISSIGTEFGGFGEDDPAALQARSLSVSQNGRVKVPLARDGVSLPPKVEIVPLMIVATAHHVMVPSSPGMLSMTLDDLAWISATADSELDLYNFCRDLSRSDLPPYFGFETINTWELWRANGKSLFSGGLAPSMMMLDPHAGDAEWDRSVQLSSVEVGLAALGLPGLRETAAAEFEPGSPAHVMSWPRIDGNATEGSARVPRVGFFERGTPSGWDVYVGAYPMAIPTSSSLWPGGDKGILLHKLAGAIAFGIGQVENEWQSALHGRDIAGYVFITGEADKNRRETPFTVVQHHTNAGPVGSIHEYEVIVDFDNILEVGDGHPTVLREHMAALIEQILLMSDVDAASAQRVRAAWEAAPPTLTFDVASARTKRHGLALPVTKDLAYTATAERLVSERVRAAGVAVGQYRGRQATELDRDILAPVTLEILLTRLSEFDRDDITRWGMIQLERVAEHRAQELANISRSARDLDVAWNPAARYAEKIAEFLNLRRGNEILVEQALRATPSGNKPIDRIAWAELLAFADVYLNATTRSENIHHQVNPLAIDVSESWVISEVEDFEPSEEQHRVRYDLDAAAFNEAVANARMRSDDLAEIAVSQERRDDVDAAMLMGYGSTPLDIYTVLYALAQWPLEDDDADAVETTLDQALVHLDDVTLLGKEDGGGARLRAALGILISTADDLGADEWKPWHSRTRKRRLLAQPFPLLSNGNLMIAPNYLVAVLGVYRGYLEQGLLPWSQPQAPAGVETALGKFRDAKNRAFEEDVAKEMRDHGWTVMTNVKETKPERLGLPFLQTEIDVVAGKAGDATIWLLEAKDPATVHATPELRRSLDAFLLDGAKPSYESQLARKHDDLAPYAAAVAGALKLPPRSKKDPYVVRTRFVTRNPVPAAFVPSKFPFSVLETLVAEIADE